MNLVSLLIVPAIVRYSVGTDKNTALRLAIALVAVALLVAVVMVSKRRGSMLDGPGGGAGAAAIAGAGGTGGSAGTGTDGTAHTPGATRRSEPAQF